MTRRAKDVTAILESWNEGDGAALGALMETAQSELQRMARGLLRGERPGHTLQPTAMVNEIYLKLRNQRRVSCRRRVEFFAVASRLMRRILVDHARRRTTLKRGGDVVKLVLDESLGISETLAPEIEALDDALIDLARRSARQSRIVEMRALVGLTLEEVAAAEGISRSTVLREWRAARLFMLSQLTPA